MNVLGCWLPLDGCTANFIVIIFFCASTAEFMTKRSLCYPWRLVLIDSLGGNWTPYDIKNSIISGLKLLKKVVEKTNFRINEFYINYCMVRLIPLTKYLGRWQLNLVTIFLSLNMCPLSFWNTEPWYSGAWQNKCWNMKSLFWYAISYRPTCLSTIPWIYAFNNADEVNLVNIPSQSESEVVVPYLYIYSCIPQKVLNTYTHILLVISYEHTYVCFPHPWCEQKHNSCNKSTISYAKIYLCWWQNHSSNIQCNF